MVSKKTQTALHGMIDRLDQRINVLIRARDRLQELLENSAEKESGENKSDIEIGTGDV